MLFAGYIAFFTVTLAIFIGPVSFFIALIAATFFGLYQGIVNTVTRALIPKYVKSSLVGTAYGMYYLVAGFSLLGLEPVVALIILAGSAIGLLWKGKR